jgi:hypothetical protein
MANPLEVAASKALVPVMAVGGLVLLYVIYREVSKSPEDREDERAEREIDAVEARRERVEDKADATYGRTWYNKLSDYFVTFATGTLLIPDRLVGGTPVQVNGRVVLPGGAVITLEQINEAGGIKFDTASEQTTFTWRGMKFAFSGQNDSEGRRIAVRA